MIISAYIIVGSIYMILSCKDRLWRELFIVFFQYHVSCCCLFRFGILLIFGLLWLLVINILNLKGVMQYDEYVRLVICVFDVCLIIFNAYVS